MGAKNIAHILNSLAMKEHDISPVKGLAGETKFDNIISKYMSNDYELINVAKQGKSGDFMIKWCSQKTNRIYKILIDIKNYSRTVPTSEVEKFHRDINLNNVDGWFFLSLNSRIMGTHKIIELKDHSADRGIVPILFTIQLTIGNCGSD